MDAKSLPEIIQQARAELKSGHYDDCCYVSFDFVTRLLDALEMAIETAEGCIASGYFVMNKEYLAKEQIEAFRKELAEVLEGK